MACIKKHDGHTDGQPESNMAQQFFQSLGHKNTGPLNFHAQSTLNFKILSLTVLDHVTDGRRHGQTQTKMPPSTSSKFGVVGGGGIKLLVNKLWLKEKEIISIHRPMKIYKQLSVPMVVGGGVCAPTLPENNAQTSPAPRFFPLPPTITLPVLPKSLKIIPLLLSTPPPPHHNQSI